MTFKKYFLQLYIVASVGNVNKNRIVREDSKQVIENSKYDARAETMKRLTATNLNESENCKMSKVSWKDELEQLWD